MVVLKEWKLDQKMNIHWMRGKEMKTLFETSIEKEPFCATHAIFMTKSSRVQVAKASRQNTWKKTFEKFSKCFSRLEVPLTRESRSESRKSLCTLHDWTFHPRTSRQHESRKTWKSRFFEKYSKYFSQLGHLPASESSISREKSLYVLVTEACDWANPRLSCQNRATLVLKILTIFVKTKYFPKTTKTLKNLFVFD